jgi:hypothetical protein
MTSPQDVGTSGGGLVTTGRAGIAAEELKLIYHDRTHAYYLNGKRAKGVSTVAKIAADDYAIRLWHERMVALGVTIDSNLRENIAMNAENKEALKNLCEDAKKTAQAHLAADRGSQKHRVLELILLGEEKKLITDQQRADAVILKRTLDRYNLVPHGRLAEQFVAYPDYTVCGRFDAVLDFDTADGRTVLVDLKSGINAINYPHSTAAQLAMYTNAPYVSEGEHRGDRADVTSWGAMPDNLDHDVAYVLLVENEGEVGSLHELDIRHGWRAAKLAMDLIAWRKEFDYGKSIVQPVTDRFTSRAMNADTVDELRAVWTDASRCRCLTGDLKTVIEIRRREVQGAA